MTGEMQMPDSKQLSEKSTTTNEPQKADTEPSVGTQRRSTQQEPPADGEVIAELGDEIGGPA